MAKPEAAVRRSSSEAHPSADQWLPWALLALALAVLIWHSSSSAFLQDDSYITYRYARNVVRGLGPVFNPGEAVEGYTNFIWMMLLSAFGIVGLPFSVIIPLSQIIGVACGLGTILIFFFLLRRFSSGPPLLAPAAVLLLAFNGSFAYWYVSGMETGLFSLTILAAFFCYLREHNRRNLFFSSALFGLSALIRPEGLLFLAIATLDLIIRGLRKKGFPALLRRLAPLVLPAIALIVPLYVWRVAYYDSFFPNTFYAKTGLSFSYIQTGVKYLLEFYQAYGLWGLAFVAPLIIVWRARRLAPGSPLLLALLIILVHAAYTVSVGGDVLRIYRFFVPILPFFYLLLGEGVWLLPAPAPVRVGILAALIPLTFFGPFARPMSVRRDIERNLVLERGLVDKMTATGNWLNSRLDKDEWFAATTIGAVSWFADRKMVDMLGLTDATIARHPENILGPRVYWKERNYNTRHVLETGPAYIYFSTGIKPSAAAERALFLRPRFRRGYFACPISLPRGKEEIVPEVIYKARPGCDTIPLEPVEDPEFIDLYVNGINALRKNPDSALAIMRRCAQQSPPDFGYPHEWIGQIFTGMKPPRTDSAIYYFEQAVSRNDWCISSHTNLGSIYARLEQREKAAEHLRKVVAYAPDNFDGYINLTVIETNLRNYEAAESTLTRAAEKFPFAAFALQLRLAYVRTESGRHDEARRILDEYLARRPGDRTALTLLEFVQRRQAVPAPPTP